MQSTSLTDFFHFAGKIFFIQNQSKISNNSVFSIRTSQFQLLGTACLFLASKFKAVEHLNSDVLVSYTDNLITSAELKVGHCTFQHLHTLRIY